ncbi:MAG: Gfo/Idh/MocA family oxidoreductase [Calditrichaeota bacterium]|nr:Gfo/Idh/MocA family oxidoreductase [Calditrichota bacterium]
MKKIRWGIIGCGNVTEVKSGPAFQKTEGSELVAVMRRNGDLARDYAQRHKVPKWYDDASELINDPDVDAVYIATPPSSHKKYTLQAAAAGKPVYVEKPMALNAEECREMVEACKTANVPLFVAYYRRALPRFLKIKEWIDSGVIGKVRFVNISFYQPQSDKDVKADSSNWRVQPEIAGGGYFVDLASHMLDFLDYVLCPVKEAQGFPGRQTQIYPAEDIVSGSFLFKSGVQVSGTWCFSAYQHQDLTEIVGDKGKISYATFDESPLVLSTKKGTEKVTIKNPQHIQQPLIQLVVNDLFGKSKCPSSGESGLRTNWVMDEMLRR